MDPAYVSLIFITTILTISSHFQKNDLNLRICSFSMGLDGMTECDDIGYCGDDEQSQSQAMVPCPHRVVDDLGSAFVMGCLGGAVWNGVKGYYHSHIHTYI
jgi:hypothetical protein